jgi:3,4-dihydroxy-2-butanone 4-phosphate synthase
MDKVMFEYDTEFEQALLEMQEHDACVVMCEVIYKHGLLKTLSRLADYCKDEKEAYALRMLSKMYKENERAFCEDAPTMQ